MTDARLRKVTDHIHRWLYSAKTVNLPIFDAPTTIATGEPGGTART